MLPIVENKLIWYPSSIRNKLCSTCQSHPLHPRGVLRNVSVSFKFLASLFKSPCLQNLSWLPSIWNYYHLILKQKVCPDFSKGYLFFSLRDTAIPHKILHFSQKPTRGHFQAWKKGHLRWCNKLIGYKALMLGICKCYLI